MTTAAAVRAALRRALLPSLASLALSVSVSKNLPISFDERPFTTRCDPRPSEESSSSKSTTRRPPSLCADEEGATTRPTPAGGADGLRDYWVPIPRLEASRKPRLTPPGRWKRRTGGTEMVDAGGTTSLPERAGGRVRVRVFKDVSLAVRPSCSERDRLGQTQGEGRGDYFQIEVTSDNADCCGVGGKSSPVEDVRCVQFIRRHKEDLTGLPLTEDFVELADGHYHLRDRWFLDVPMPRSASLHRARAPPSSTAGETSDAGRTRPLRLDALYYDTRGMHNRGEQEFSVFDAPRGSFDPRRHSLYRADFVTYLLSAEGRVFWKVEWSQVARLVPAGGDKNDNGANVGWGGQEWARPSKMDRAELRAQGLDISVGYESIRGGPASEFDDEFAENVWLVGYTTDGDHCSTVFLPAVNTNAVPFRDTLQHP